MPGNRLTAIRTGIAHHGGRINVINLAPDQNGPAPRTLRILTNIGEYIAHINEFEPFAQGNFPGPDQCIRRCGGRLQHPEIGMEGGKVQGHFRT